MLTTHVSLYVLSVCAIDLIIPKGITPVANWYRKLSHSLQNWKKNFHLHVFQGQLGSTVVRSMTLEWEPREQILE